MSDTSTEDLLPGSAPGSPRSRERRTPPRHQLAAALWILVACLALALFLRLVVISPYKIPTSSMEPALRGEHPESGTHGDTVLVLRTAYWFTSPRRWDLVAFRAKSDPEGAGPLELVKRVAALPGERVEILDGEILVNGLRLERPPELRKIHYLRKGSYGLEALELGADEYFVLGDNSYLSQDSRHWGPLSRKQIFGKVVAICLPLERAGWLNLEDGDLGD